MQLYIGDQNMGKKCFLNNIKSIIKTEVVFIVLASNTYEAYEFPLIVPEELKMWS